MRLISLTIFVAVCFAITTGAHNAPAFPELMPQASQQASTVTATFTSDGYTLSITAQCDTTGPWCQFRAEISAPPALLKSIERVEYVISPGVSRSPSIVTEASTGFRFEEKQVRGEKVYAAVTLRPRGGTHSKVVQLEGTIPFGVDVKPPLPAGLRFEDRYRPQFLEGVPHKPVEYFFTIWLRGDAAALSRIRSVEYQLPQSHFSSSRVVANAGMEYMIDGTMPAGAKLEIVALIRWKDGTRSTHAIPFRVR